MTEEKMQVKKKVYVETTAVSDAAALPSHDIVQLGRSADALPPKRSSASTAATI